VGSSGKRPPIPPDRDIQAPTPSAAVDRIRAKARPTPTRRELLTLAAVLAATALTAAAAFAGLSRQAAPVQAPTPTVSQVIGAPATAAPRVEPGD
jgi:hypothetical protein